MLTDHCLCKKGIVRAAQWLLPKCEKTDPKNISIALLLFGILTAVVYFFATYFAAFYFLGVILIAIRLIVEKLEEQVALTYQKQTSRAILLKIISPEIADILLLIAIILADFDYIGIGDLAMGVCWAMILFDLAGFAVNHESEKQGPLQEPYRILTLVFASFLQFFAQIFHWPVDFIYLFLVWIIIGGLITIVIRWRHLFKATATTSII